MRSDDVQPSCDPWRRTLPALLAGGALAALVACDGDGDDAPPTQRVDFRSVVVFGNGLGGVGTCAPAIPLSGDGRPPHLGTRFTNNAESPRAWVEKVTAQLGLPLVPSELGFAGRPTVCDAARIAALTGDAVTTGSSLWCNATPGSPLNGLRAGADPDRFLFADFIHRTHAGRRAFAQGVMQALRDQGWVR